MQAVRNICTKNNVNQPDILVATQVTTEYGISFIPRVDELTKQLTEAKKTCKDHGKKYETEVSRLMDIAAKHNLMQQMTADNLEHASGDVVSLVASSKKRVMRFMTCQVNMENNF